MRVPTLFLLLTCTLMGCAPPTYSDFTATLLNPAPLHVGRRTLEFRLVQREATLEAETVKIEGQMTHAGMGTVFDTARRVKPGVYRAEGFDLNMAGDWVLELSLERGQRTERGELRLSVNP
ncbi:MAG: FixH family protein [Pleurocapsa sp. SU_196_0]|nr:FixH family protein [Pleurocapsa sp. SU_196_0]